MSDDVLALALSGLEVSPPVRPAFAAALRAQLHAELGFGAQPAVVPEVARPEVSARPAPVAEPAPGVLRRFLDSLRPMTPRMAVLIALAVLLAACAVAATVIILRGWVSTGPRGYQYTDDFTAGTVYRGTAEFYDDLLLAPDGRSILALRPMHPAAKAAGDPAVVRFTLGGSTLPAPTEVFALDKLLDPAYWDPGIDLTGAMIAPSGEALGGDQLSVAPRGDLFIAVSVYDAGRFNTESQGYGNAASLVAVRPDGSAQKVVTAGEMAATGLLDHPGTPTSIVAAASADDWLWARTEVQITDPAIRGATWSLFEIVDPTADGDWSDRVIRALELPDSVPKLEYGVYDWSYGPFVAEPSLGGHDRSRSILLPMLSREGEYRIYRIADPNGDGDASDPGETALLFTGNVEDALSSPPLAPRVVLDGSDVVLDELVVAGLDRPSRVSRITTEGVVDIVRALEWTPLGLVADRAGAIYHATSEQTPGGPQDSFDFVIERLTPVPVGEGSAAPAASPSGSPTAEASAAPTEAELVELAPLSGSAPNVAVWLMASEGDGSEMLLVGADGSGPAWLVPGEHNGPFCQSADGSLTGYWSDQDVPNEKHLYVAAADGSSATKLSETAKSFLCGFPSDAMLIDVPDGGWEDIIRHDLATGDETPIAKKVTPLDASPDGRRRAVVTGTTAWTLHVLDTKDGTMTPVAGPFGQQVLAAPWSPDGKRIAFIVGPTSSMDPNLKGTFEVHVVDVEPGSSTAPPRERMLLKIDGQKPVLSWSADSRRLAVRSPTHETKMAELAGDALLVDVATGSSETVGSEDVIFAGFSPVDAETYAYATPEALFVATIGAQPRKIADVPSGALCPDCSEGPVSRWPGGEWMGWSPDGRYIGLGTFSAVVGVVDVASGQLSVLLTDDDQRMLVDTKWWR